MESAQQALAVLFVLSLLGLAIWFLRGSKLSPALWKASAKEKALESVDRLALTPQHSLHLVRVNGREVLIATSPQGCRVIPAAQDKRAIGA